MNLLMRTLNLIGSLMVLFAVPLTGMCQDYDADAALAVSQAVLGGKIEDVELVSVDGRTVHLSDYQGQPLLISMIFTSCHHVCPAITQHLANAADVAREALGENSFKIVTIGFDTANDSPQAMNSFAHAQGVDDPHWDFLSASAQSMESIVSSIGFVYFPSPRGFDHINQLTVVDRDGVIYQQVYGGAFELPWMVEPLKELVFNQPRQGVHLAAGFLDRIRLFCTVYDPNSGRYRFDYSLFIQIAVGGLVVFAVAFYLLLEFRRSRKRKKGQRGS